MYASDKFRISHLKAALKILLLLVFLLACKSNSNWENASENPEFIHRAIKKITDVMVADIYSPPVASRTYSYISIAGYEAGIQGNKKYVSLQKQLHGLDSLPKPSSLKAYSPALASSHAILMIGKSLVFSEQKVKEFDDQLLEEFKATGMPDEVYQNSISYADSLAKRILKWASKDNYKQTRAMTKYSGSDEPGSWKPTPPSYLNAVEPFWFLIRPMIIDSAGQFKPAPALAFSIDKQSQFYKEAVKVRDTGNNLTDEQVKIANFWDCNPFKMNIYGHVMYATKKISPGGHWINITRLACQKSKFDVAKTLEAYARISITISDGFISCWEEKFRSKVTRPETYINQYVDENWVPQLQTPPFPEYTSGHSVVSAASSIILGELFGDNFQYTDSTEVEFKIPVRHFKSFKQAAEEAAISRFYGGIHYMPSITNGLKEGIEIGSFINKKLITRSVSHVLAAVKKR